MHLAGREHQGVEASLAVAERVDFGRATAPGAPDCLILLPPFAPAAERCACIEVLSTMTRSGGSAQPASAASKACHTRAGSSGWTG
jgi:hypothetical protein